MKILRATHLGWCSGVRNAVALVANEARRGRVAVLGELVHNETVNAALRAAGVQLTGNLDALNADTVIVTPHGLSDTKLARVRERVPRVLDATCPLVRRAHRAMRELVAAGFHPVVIGQRGHVEVRGLTEDLAEFDVVLTKEDVRLLPPRWRYGVIAQTTQPVERVQQLLDAIRRRFAESEVRFVDTVCRPTKLRRAAAIALAQHCDAVVVIGGARSNNTRELATTCARCCRRVFRVESAGELNASWFDDAETIGITAGTSTPDEVIEAVEQWLWTLAEVKHEIHQAA
ncbi:MAG: 4-hydroxy-3-methylbut-2-enyl diphosphate reductase [Verrucomicrobia bacterium]|nr:4-hydroxy-3-methylbut-2-enyl diphosphate reductase [Verrucomicrobiota bacterium]